MLSIENTFDADAISSSQKQHPFRNKTPKKNLDSIEYTQSVILKIPPIDK